MATSALKVLLVEDSPSDAQLLQEYLKLVDFERFEVTHVEKLGHALELLRARPFDVVLLDLSLPDSHGQDTFVRARREASHVPLVILSGTSDEMLSIEAVRQGVQDYLVKGQSDERQIARTIRYAIERKRMEDALRLSEERFRLASDATRAVVYDVDLRSGRAISVHGLPALLGYGADETPMTSTWWFDQVHPDDLIAAQNQLRDAIERQSDYSFQYRVLHKDGHCLFVQDTGQIIRGERGLSARVVGSVVDITRRRQLEDALRESEERLRLAVNAANEAIWDWNLQDGKVQLNEIYERLFGLPSAGTDPEQWWKEHIHPGDRDQVASSLRAALDGDGDSWTAEYRFLTRDGGYADIYDRAFIARDRSGVATRFVSAMMNQTERKRAEAALRESEDRYRRLAGELERMVEERTADLRRINRTLQMISDCNEAIVRAVREEDLLAEICRIIVEVGDYRMAWVGFAEEDKAKTVLPVACAGFEDGYLGRVKISWADGEHDTCPAGAAICTGRLRLSRSVRQDSACPPWRQEELRSGFESSVSLPLGSGGRTFGCLNIYSSEPDAFGKDQVLRELADDIAFGITALRTRAERDRTRRALEQRSIQLRTLAAELSHVEERERRRLAQAVHDNLQQLLVGAKLCSDTLRKRCQTADTLEVVEHLNEFVKEAIDTARSLTSELSPPILYDAGLAAALEWMGRWMKDKHGLEVSVKADRRIEPESEDVRVLLFQATRELLFNVVKHAQVKKARVHMSRTNRRQVRITVEDKGAGFDPAQSRGGDVLHGGFGLFSIRGRLDLVGGKLDIESAPGRGSRFIMVAPLHAVATAEPAPEIPAAGPLPAPRRHRVPPAGRVSRVRRKIRVLLADDHSLMRQGLVRLLREYREIDVVGEAADGLEALELARQTKPDVVLMDVSMPRMNGVEATSRLTGEMPHVRVIALSMWEESDWGTAMSKAGAVAYINKAGPMEALVDTIRACCPDNS